MEMRKIYIGADSAGYALKEQIKENPDLKIITVIDDLDYKPYIYEDITPGFDLWCEGLKKHWFVMNSKDFKYFDYYTSLARVRGCLNKTMYAETFAVYERKIVKKGGIL